MTARNNGTDGFTFPKVPKIPNKVTNNVNMIAGFSACCSLCIFAVYLLLWIFTLILLIFWTKLHYDLDNSIPRTFGWEVIIGFLGSTYDDCRDYSTTKPIQVASHESCKYYHSSPSVPIMAEVLHSFIIIVSIYHLLEVYAFNFAPRLGLKCAVLNVILHLMFTGRNIIWYIVFFGSPNQNLKSLEHTMKAEMDLFQDSPKDISPKFEITQYSQRCCGVNNFTDWKFKIFPGDSNPRYPRTCCDKSTFPCKFYPDRHEVYQDGCLSREIDMIQQYAGQVMGLTLCGCIVSIAFFILMYLVDTISFNETKGTVSLRLSRHPHPIPDDNRKDKGKRHRKDPLGSGDNSKISGGPLKEATECRMNADKVDEGRSWNIWNITRNASVHVSLNSWGICWKTDSEVKTEIHVPQKETEV